MASLKHKRIVLKEAINRVFNGLGVKSLTDTDGLHPLLFRTFEYVWAVKLFLDETIKVRIEFTLALTDVQDGKGKGIDERILALSHIMHISILEFQ